MMKTLSENMATEIKQMLKRFYDGDASQEDIRTLNEFFANTDAEELPEDMRDDADIFKIMAIETKALEEDVPDGLEDSIRSVIDIEPKKPRTIKFMPWISVAAAAIIIFILTVLPVWKTSETTHNDLLADKTPTIDSIKTVNENDNLSVAEVKINDNVTETTNIDEKEVNEDDDNYIEIDDPEEAARITAEALTLIRDKMALAHNSIEKADEQLKNINTSIKRILDNEKI